MKQISIFLSLSVFAIQTFAQKNTVAAGGVATGVGGTVSYSFGQIDYITASGAGGSASQGVQQVYRLNVNLKYYIQGYYDAAGLMRPVMLNEGVGSSLSNVDSVTIELHNTTSPYALAHSYTGLLQTNGTISCVFPNASAGSSYYVVLKHRNSVQTWSAAPVVLNEVTNYDFSTAASQAFGSNQILAAPGIFAVYNADVNQDDNVDLLDISNIETDINAFNYGYIATDINGDGNADLLDSPFVEENTNNFVFAATP